MFWSFFFSFKIWLQNQLFRSSGLCNLQRPSFDGILKKSSQQVWEQKWEKYVISEEKFIWDHLLCNVHLKLFSSSPHPAFGTNDWNYLNMTLFPWFLSHFISTLLLTLFLISFWHFPWFPSYSFSNFPLTCTRPGFLSVVDSWWGGFMCVGLLCKRNTNIFQMLWSFLFPIEIWLQNQLFRISGFCNLPFCVGGCMWVALQKKYKSSVCWPAKKITFNFLVLENFTWVNDCLLAWDYENVWCKNVWCKIRPRFLHGATTQTTCFIFTLS